LNLHCSKIPQETLLNSDPYNPWSKLYTRKHSVY
jgi:hypothetical protein